MPTLIALSEDIISLSEKLDDALELSGGEITPDVETILTRWFELDGQLEEKADGYAGLIRERVLRASVRRSEMERLKKLVASDEALAARLKDRLKAYMEVLGRPKIETDRYSIRVQRNGGHLPITLLCPAEELPPELQKITVEADLEKIRSVLKAAPGGAMSFARLEPPGSHLRIS